ncbi:UDP-glucose 4-epimerase [Bacillus pakistanensis]|uniref:UDP-glucose 4-epimerase n=1 Tax=Rossellomorea pakistanensis TaxID=992288 RepID=A0ABS2NGE0_9BACI|nr:NAD-dependent epimerase/dehydratase family protein [Bacillus pakistanensis]MBM7586927.1 UDP-glucose 4-epimerase [Bacillus pakistanensis]
MKAIVTGGAGFIGSHLVEALINKGVVVHVIDNYSTGKHSNIHPLAIPHNMDICSIETKNLIVNEKPDLLFHLAAQADVEHSTLNPYFDADVNIMGTINLLEACKEASVKKFIFSSTSAVYGDTGKKIIHEEDFTLPISYYGLSKLSAEHYIKLYNNIFGQSYTILRYGNVYGPRQTAKGEGGVIAVFLKKMKNNDSLKVHGDGMQTRDYIYVKDVASANIAAIENGKNGTFQICTGKSTSIIDLIRILDNTHLKDLHYIHTNERVGDIKHSCLANSKAINELKWTPDYDIKSGVLETYKISMNS